MIRKPLGRGLDALIGAPSAPVSALENPPAAEVPIDALMPSPLQPRARFAEAPMQELVESIRAHGVLEPLIVRPASTGAPDGVRFEIVAGERRMRAARAAGLVTVPVVMRAFGDREALEVSLVENIVRHELSAIEEARAFQTLWKQFGLSHEEIAAKIGKSRPYVSNQIRLLELPAQVCDWIDEGRINATMARALLAIPDPRERLNFAAEGIRDAATINELDAKLDAAIRKAPARAARLARTTRDPNLVALMDELRRALKRKVKITRGRGKTPGRIEMEYYGDADLDALASMLLDSSQLRASA